MTDDVTPMTDAEIGATMRRLARACSPSFDEARFQRYARWLHHSAISCAGRRERGEPIVVDRVIMKVDGGGQLNGMLEHLLEFIVESPCGVINDPMVWEHVVQEDGITF